MLNKIIILAWHFNINTCNLTFKDKKGSWINIKEENNFYILQFNSCEFVETNKENIKFKIYIIGFDKNNIKNKSDEIDIVNQKINEIMKNNKNNETLLLLHKNPWYENVDWFQKSNDKTIIKIFTSGSLYFSPTTNEGILDFEKDCFVDSSIEKLNWKFVWKEFYIELKQKKNKLNKIWLPLAIDIQGLTEVNKETRLKYLNEIRKDKDYDKLIEIHNDIVLNIDECKEFEINESKYSEIKSLIDSLNSNDDIDAKFLNSQKDIFIPNFLNKINNKFNELIKKRNAY